MTEIGADHPWLWLLLIFPFIFAGFTFWLRSLRSENAAVARSLSSVTNLQLAQKKLFESIDVPVAGFDEWLRITWMNKAALELLRAKQLADVLGKSFSEVFVTTTGIDVINRRLQEIPEVNLSASRENYVIEVPVIDLDHQYHELLVSVQSVRDSEGRLAGFVAFGRFQRPLVKPTASAISISEARSDYIGYN